MRRGMKFAQPENVHISMCSRCLAHLPKGSTVCVAYDKETGGICSVYCSQNCFYEDYRTTEMALTELNRLKEFAQELIDEYQGRKLK